MTEFCSCDFAVWEAPASLKLCIEVILCTELKQSYCEFFWNFFESVPAVFAKLSWNFRPSLSVCSSLAGNRQYITYLSIYYLDMTYFDGLYLKKSRFACSNWYFIWAKWSTARRAVMVYSARSITLLLASFDVALTSEREKLSWIDWTIKISPCTHWFLLGLFLARMLHFRASHHTTYCARRSLTSYRPVMHACSHFGARVCRRHMMRETALAAAGPSTFWWRASQWVSLRAA